MGRRAISRAFSMERRLEKIRSWKRCSVGSSNRSERSMSLESGLMLCRLNQELLPDPGRPIARTTTPFGARGVAALGGAGAGVFGARTPGAVTTAEALSCGEGWAGAALRGTDSPG